MKQSRYDYKYEPQKCEAKEQTRDRAQKRTDRTVWRQLPHCRHSD